MIREGETPLRVAVIGARRERQGTGEFVARELARAGCRVDAILGTSEASVETARRTLAARYAIDCRGYLSLDRLLEREPVDVVAVCSPAEHHEAQVEACLRARRHILCEKPFFWPRDLESRPLAEVRRRVEALVDLAEGQERFLGLNTQWPETLPSFTLLHPNVLHEPLRTFSMHLGPSVTGLAMLVESASHLLSLLHALAGPGTIERPRVAFSADEKHVDLELDYVHRRGAARVSFRLDHSPTPPRPASYEINGRRVVREIDPASYAFTFVADGRRVPVRDPLASLVDTFVGAVRSGRRPDRASLTNGMTQLHELVAAATQGSHR